jgi:hypothetical protein
MANAKRDREWIVMAREVDIRWSDKIDFVDRHRKTKNINHYGLYMFIERGYDRVDRLIYIGIVKSDARDFHLRMNEHARDWLHSISKGDVFVKFGILHSHEPITEQLIEDAESALVFDAEPPENSQKMKSYTIEDELIVRNFNHEGFVKRTINTRKHPG